MPMDYSKLPDMCSKGKEENLPASQVKEDKPKVIVNANVRKPSFGKRLLRVFIADDVPNIKEHIVEDLLIPSVKNAVASAVKDTIDMAIFGQVRGRSGSNGGRTSYSSYYDDKPRASISRSTRIEPSEIVFDTKADADIALDTLNDYIQRYHKVSLADFYEVGNVRGNGHTDENYGWFDISDARVTNYRGEWIIDMPRYIDIRDRR